MSPSLYVRLVRRESRGSRGRLLFFTLCLAVGVAAVVSVAGLASSLDQGIRSEARQLLAADLAVESSRPFPEEVERAIAAIRGVERTDVKEMPTVVARPPREGVPGPSQLVELKAVAGEYPFYGRLRLNPAGPLSPLLDPEGVVVAPELMGRLSLEAGDTLRIGNASFTIRGQVLSEPDRINVSFTLGPRIFMSIEGLRRAGLEAFGSRITRRALLKMPEGSSTAAVTAAAESIRKSLPKDGSVEVETFAEAQPALRSGLRRAERFLGLVALVSLLVGGIGVAQTVRSWLASRMDAIAVLKCLGLRPREVLLLYVGQTTLLGLVGSLAGAALGIAMMLALPGLLTGLVPEGAVRLWQPWAVLRGLGLGIGVALIFSVPPLVALRRVPPLRVLRRDAEPLPGSLGARALAAGGLLAGVFAVAWFQSGTAAWGGWFTAGIVAATGVLAAAATALTRSVGRFSRPAARVWIRHGLTAIARPGAGTLGAILALGLGVLVVLGMYLVQSRLSEQLRAELPSGAPTAFFIDIQPDQWSGVRSALEAAGATRLEAVPIVTARLLAVDGRRVEDLVRKGEEDGRRRWVFTREQRMTYLRELPDGNVVVEGALWSDPSRPEIALERDFARDLGAKLGSTLTLDIQGVPLELAVTSLRTVDWKTFGINFFMVVEPGVLENAPQMRVAVARLPAGREQAIQDDLAAKFPNVTVLRIRDILEKVVAILDRVGLGVRLLGGFTVLAGIAILAGAVSAGSVRRGREVALLKTLGMTRRGVIAVFSVEYALVGLVAGAIGATGAGVLAWFILTRGMEIPWELRPAPYGIALLGTAALAVIAGVASSLRALSRRPIDVLRAEQ